ncbi:MAG: TIGR02453 family protein [Pseudomonadota bacterium]
MSDAVAFDGFPDETLKFLKALGFHQNREWFHENKKLYEKVVKNPLGDLIEAASARFEEDKIPLRATRKASVYRVNRDVRFSKNKDPYNTHMSGLLTRNGTKKDQGFVYVHISNESTFIAAGFYGMEGDEIRAMRDLIVREPDVMRKVAAKLEKAGYTMEEGHSLKRLPQGFDKNLPDDLQAWVKLKNFVFMERLDNSVIHTPKLIDRMANLAKTALPFLEFGWRAVDPLREENAA